MITSPLIYLATSIRSGEKHLQEAIASILNRTLHNPEFSITNDGLVESTNSTHRSPILPVNLVRDNEAIAAKLFQRPVSLQPSLVLFLVTFFLGRCSPLFD